MEDNEVAEDSEQDDIVEDVPLEAWESNQVVPQAAPGDLANLLTALNLTDENQAATLCMAALQKHVVSVLRQGNTATPDDGTLQTCVELLRTALAAGAPARVGHEVCLASVFVSSSNFTLRCVFLFTVQSRVLNDLLVKVQMLKDEDGFKFASTPADEVVVWWRLLSAAVTQGVACSLWLCW